MGPLLYIILWILIPAANTTAEKLSMMGKPINITNIEKKVKEEFGNVKDETESARLAGFGTPAYGFQEVYVHSSEKHKAEGVVANTLAEF